MVLAIVLRNVGKVNGSGLLKAARLGPLKTYSTIVATQRSAVLAPKLKDISLLRRNISLTAPKYASGSNHAPLWTLEKLVSVGLLCIIPAAFLAPSQPLDALMAVSAILHSHWGFAAIIQDYVRPSVVGPVLPVVASVALFMVSTIALGGLFYLIYNDIGIAKTIQQFWAIKGGTKCEDVCPTCD